MHKYMGKKAKDKITGFAGLVTGHAEYLTGCDQFLLQPAQKKGSTDYPAGQWFDEQRLVVTEGKPIALDNSKGDGAMGMAPVK